MQQKPAKIKLSFSELGKRGAAALNNDPVKKRASILKGIETKRRKALLAKIDSLSKDRQLNEYQKLMLDDESKKTRGANL
jgi:hypothetical protein